MARLALLSVALVLSGCASEVVYVDRPVEVLVPVPVRREVPEQLSAEYLPSQLPKFTSPSSPSAVVGLSEEDLNRLKTILRTLTTREKAWRAWALEGAKP